MEKQTNQSLTFPAFTASPTAICVKCGDPRFKDAFESFTEGSRQNGMLGYLTGQYIDYVVPGGVYCLAEGFGPHYQKAMEDIKFYLNHFKTIATIIFFGHEDCGFYKTKKSEIGDAIFLLNYKNMADRQKADLAIAMKNLQKHGVKTSFKLFYAKFANSEQTLISFEEIHLII